MNAPFLVRPPPTVRTWSAPEAYLGILTLVAVWDGQNASSRLAAVHAFAKRSPFLHPLGEKGLVALHTKVVERIGAAGEEALQQAGLTLPVKMRSSVYAVCVDIVSSAGVLAACDRALLANVRSLLSIDPVLAEQIETVILLKNLY